MHGWITDPGATGGLRLADDLPEPVPAEDEALVEVRAYSINRGELALVKMRPDGWRPGQDLAGVVAQAAASGEGPPAGTRVVGLVDWECWAERVAVPIDRAIPLPDSVSFEQAASLPIAGLTALRALGLGGSVVGRRVLITGATGGVGQFAIQLAAAAGADVTALVRFPDRKQMARELGANEAVHHLDGDLGRVFRLILDGVGGQVLTDAVHLLEAGGMAVTYGTLGGPAQLTLRDFPAGPVSPVMWMFHAYPLQTRGRDLATLVSFVANGRVKPLLGMVRDWRETVQALDGLREGEVRGKAVMQLT